MRIGQPDGAHQRTLAPDMIQLAHRCWPPRSSCIATGCSPSQAPWLTWPGGGFGREIVEQAQLGFAAGDELMRYLAWRDLPVHMARRCGLLDADGHDRLAGRIIFPKVRQAEPVWLIGRLLEAAPDGPKYLRLPGTKPLLGWDLASGDLRGVCLVEGPLDLLALRLWGVPALALCGTGLSPETVSLLAQWDRLYAVLDADTAGQEATARLVAMLGSRVIPVALPAGVKDPAELADRSDGNELFRAAIRRAVLCQSAGAPLGRT